MIHYGEEHDDNDDCGNLPDAAAGLRSGQAGRPIEKYGSGAKTAAYVGAFMQNIAWNKVVNRFTARH